MTLNDMATSAWWWLVAIAAGALAVSWMSFVAFTWFALSRWGKSARGTVTSSVESHGQEDVVYVVTYEFTAASVGGQALPCSGRQTMRHPFRKRDVVAVRYWPRWPRLNRLAERAI